MRSRFNSGGPAPPPVAGPPTPGSPNRRTGRDRAAVDSQRGIGRLARYVQYFGTIYPNQWGSIVHEYYGHIIDLPGSLRLTTGE